MVSYRQWIIPIRILWSAAMLAALSLFAFAMSAGQRIQNPGEVELSLWENVAGQVGISPARDGGVAQAGIYEGDILVAVNDIPVSSVEQAQATLRRAVGGSVVLTVHTGNFPERRVTVLTRSDSRRVLGTLGVSGETAATVDWIANLLFAIACTAIALVIAWNKWADGYALLVSLTLVVVLLGASTPVLSMNTPDSSLHPWLSVWLMVAFGLLLAFFYLFPSGRFAPPQTRLLLVAFAIWTLVGLVFPAVYPWFWQPLFYLPVFIGVIGTGAIAQNYRYRASASPEERQQVRWVALGCVALVTGLLLQIMPRNLGFENAGTLDLVYGLVLYPLGFMLKLALPVSIGVAILRYHLWDMNLVVNRTLVYGALTLSIIGLYVLGVGVLGAVFQSTNTLVVSLVMTGIVAVLFQPLRDRLQRGVNRLMYGQRDEPFLVVAQLGKQLETAPTPDAMLPTLVETIAHTMKLPYVAIETASGENSETAAAYGQVPPRVVRLPMQYQAETVGQLVVAPRGGQAAFSAADLNLLTTIVQQTGTAVHAVQLTADLQRSRERLVMAREEERRRIRRDLHDGLGPALAALAMQADMARELARTDAPRTEELLSEITFKAQEAIQDVRRLVYNLRPPALDELGLAGALRQHAASFTGQLYVTLDLPDEMPALPAAVEVAAYRITQEALNNVAHHAHAKHCTVRLGLNHALQLEIADDGRGIPAGARPGVGLISMRERAAELGGTCVIESAPGNGTRVSARLPVSPA